MPTIALYSRFILMSPQPRKRFSQHWLRSEKVLDDILAAAEIKAGDRILEIGPGTGVLTRRLLNVAEAVVAVEIDRDLCQQLRKTFKDAGNLQLIEADFLALDLGDRIDEQRHRPNKVIANIPYNITGPIVQKLLGTIPSPRRDFECLVLLLQKEVGDRLCASPGSKTYGALSVRVQYLAECEPIVSVPARAFSPPPKVDSVVVRLRPRPFSPAARSPQKLATLVKLGFANRRKMLRNNLTSLLSKEDTSRVLEQLNVDPQARAEDLSLDRWVALSDILDKQSLNSASS